MSHTITIGGLLLTLAAVGGVVTTLFGLLMIFAGGMSDAPAAGDAVGKQGCITTGVGAVTFIGAILALLT